MEYLIDVSNTSAVVASPCTPRTDFQTGEQRTDRQSGRGIWDVTLLVGNGAESEQIKVKMLEEVKIPQMTPVRTVGLRITRLRMRDGQEVQFFSVDTIVPATDAGTSAPVLAPVPAPATAPDAAAGSAGQPGGKGTAGKAGA